MVLLKFPTRKNILKTELERISQTRLVKRDNRLTSSNFDFYLDSKRAYSYHWWLFVRTFNGKVIFNNTRYSPTTSKHQRKALVILDYKYDLKLRYTKLSLGNLDLTLRDEISGIELEIKDLKNLIVKKGSRKTSNDNRLHRIKELMIHEVTVRTYLKEYLNEID